MTTPVTLIGNLTGDPELRYTPSGAAVASFTIAVNERVKNPTTGEWEDGEGSFYRCSAWRDAAENVSETLTKGMRVIVSGGLKMRSYERREGGQGLSPEVEVAEVGPSLRWATATVRRSAPNHVPTQGTGADRIGYVPASSVSAAPQPQAARNATQGAQQPQGGHRAQQQAQRPAQGYQQPQGDWLSADEPPF